EVLVVGTAGPVEVGQTELFDAGVAEPVARRRGGRGVGAELHHAERHDRPGDGATTGATADRVGGVAVVAADERVDVLRQVHGGGVGGGGSDELGGQHDQGCGGSHGQGRATARHGSLRTASFPRHSGDSGRGTEHGCSSLTTLASTVV